MKRVLLVFLLLLATTLFAQTEQKLGEAFLKSVQEKNFSLLKPWLGSNTKTIQEKWKKVVENAHRNGFDIKAVKIKNVMAGEQVPNMPMKTIIAIYEYNGKEWDDLVLMITTGQKPKLVEIPLTSYIFKLAEERRGKNRID
jgi:hypothetical protein